MKDIRNLFRKGKGTEAIKDGILRDLKNLSEHEYEEEGNYYKPGRVRNFWSNSCIQYKSNSDKDRTLTVEDYLKITPYLKVIKNNLKKSLHVENSINNSKSLYYFHR